MRGILGATRSTDPQRTCFPRPSCVEAELEGKADDPLLGQQLAEALSHDGLRPCHRMVGVGSALGGMMRYALTLGFERGCRPPSLATLTANVAGSFVIGASQCGFRMANRWLTSASIFSDASWWESWEALPLSSFSLQTLELMQKGQLTSAILTWFSHSSSACWPWRVAKCQR